MTGQSQTLRKHLFEDSELKVSTSGHHVCAPGSIHLIGNKCANIFILKSAAWSLELMKLIWVKCWMRATYLFSKIIIEVKILLLPE
jgi:hypothetical protein